MTVNVNALIGCLGKTYQEIFDAGLIPYKTKPSATSGDPDISLDMAKEGVFLSFKREGRIFNEMTLTILDSEKKDWVFPNVLPTPLKQHMSRTWVHETLGLPIKSSPPETIMRREFGWVELYEIKDSHMPICMQIDYDLHQLVRSVTFLPASEVRW